MCMYVPILMYGFYYLSEYICTIFVFCLFKNPKIEKKNNKQKQLFFGLLKVLEISHCV